MQEEEEKTKANERKMIGILLRDPYWDMRKGYYAPRSYYINANGDMCQIINGEWKLI